MKKPERKAASYLIVFLLILYIFFGCKSTQTSVSTDENLESKSTKFDSINISLKVKETESSETKQGFKIPDMQTGIKNCDSLCDIAVNNALSSINLEQNNGKNQLKLYYDKLQKTLFLYNKLKGSKDSIAINSKVNKQYYHVNHRKTITITKTTNILTQEQMVNLWTGRIFWVGLLAFGIYRLRKIVIG
ncbi:hypothetical protein [Flavobacterium sp.]|uniref:hypothetical protein n=1 Tax=Flavobacterium sp. TaxID=239 RepID=UPI00391C73D2